MPWTDGAFQALPWHDGEIVYAEGFGVRELGKDDPVTPDTLFGIGSMTKSINAMMVASLVDDGFLEMMASLNGIHSPRRSGPNFNWPTPTLHRLLPCATC